MMVERDVQPHSEPDTAKKNISDMIASCIAHAGLGKLYAPEVAAQPSLEQSTIDDYCLMQSKQTKRRREHPLVTVLKPDAPSDKAIITADAWPIHQEDTAKSLARAMAISAIVGDHDVNTTNMLVIQEEDDASPTIKRINLGHAFNDLLRAPSEKEGKLHEIKHPIFDFFNRRKVTALSKSSPSKVWRDYDGLVPSITLGDALMTLGEQKETLIQGVNNAKVEFQVLMQNEANQQSILNSLQAIQHAMDGDTLQLDDHAIDTFFDKLQLFIRKNADDALLAGKMMILQAEMRQALHAPIQDLNEFTKQWKNTFKEEGLINEQGQMICPWFKTSLLMRRPFQGDLKSYIIHEHYSYLMLEYPKAKTIDALKAIYNSVFDFINYIKGYLASIQFAQKLKGDKPSTSETLEGVETSPQADTDTTEPLSNEIIQAQLEITRDELMTQINALYADNENAPRNP